jgi:hypothetical protein
MFMKFIAGLFLTAALVGGTATKSGPAPAAKNCCATKAASCAACCGGDCEDCCGACCGACCGGDHGK